MNMFVSIVILLCVLIQTPLMSSDELEVFAVVRSIYDPQPKVKKKTNEFDGEKIYLNKDRLDLIEPSDWLFTEFYMFNWKDTYNLLIQKCSLSEEDLQYTEEELRNCNYVTEHYAKKVKGTTDKRSKKKYLKIDFHEYNLRDDLCRSSYKFTIEDVVKEEFIHPTTRDREEYTEEKIKTVIVKSFYLTLCD